MNELVKENFYIEGDFLKIEKRISLNLIKVINVINKRSKCLYTYNDEFFYNIEHVLKTDFKYKLYGTRDCLEYIEKFKESVCLFKKIKCFEDEIYLSESDLIDLFFDCILILTDINDNTLIKKQILMPKKDLDDILMELRDCLPKQCNDELDSKMSILKLIKSELNSIDVLESICYILRREMVNLCVFTYILKEKSGFYKIGRSKNVDRRLKDIKCGNPTVEIIKTYKGDYENMLHRIFESKKVCGEWFALTQEDLDNISLLIDIDGCKFIVEPKNED